MPESWNALKAVQPIRREDLTTAALCIERDFYALVETLKRTMELADSSDEELLECFSNTKAVAQRGLRLSKILLRVTRNRRRLTGDVSSTAAKQHER